MLIYLLKYSRVSVNPFGFRVSVGFGFGVGFSPESGFGSGFDFGFWFWVHEDSTRSEPDPLSSLIPHLLEVIEEGISMWIAAGYWHLGALDALRRAG
jgi:hypothetical protein